MENADLVGLTADIVSSHVSNNSVAIGDMPRLVQEVHQALAGLTAEPGDTPEHKVPVVSAKASVKQDFITCMECGKKHKTLKRHLMNDHGMTPEQYRADFELPLAYPMVAPEYSERRRALAKAMGLGRKAGNKPKSASADASSEKPPRKQRARKKQR